MAKEVFHFIALAGCLTIVLVSKKQTGQSTERNLINEIC